MTKTCFAVPEGTIYIRADGSIDPPTASISSLDNVTYTLTGDIFNDSIVIERDNTVFDGKGFALNGAGSPMHGITLSSRSNVTVENIEIIGFTYCVWVESSTNVVISRNSILIQEPSPSVYPSGIHLLMSANSTITENKVSVTSSYGIYLEHSFNNTIIGNNVTTNARIGVLSGITIYYSSHNLMQNNSVVGNSTYLSVAGTNVEDFVNDVDSSNIVGGKPVCYWIKEENKTVPTNAGCVTLVNCSNIKAENLTLSQGNPAIILVNTWNSTIAESHVENSQTGIMLLGSDSNRRTN